MIEYKDWILDNLRTIRTAKGIKTETLAAGLGISQSEYSKIENGKRKNYTDLVPQLALLLGVSFHDLVKNGETNYINYGEVKDHGMAHNNNYSYTAADEIKNYQARLNDKDDIIRLEREQKEMEREQKEFWKAEYQKLKLDLTKG